VWKLACPKREEGLVFPTAEGKVEHHANMLRSLAPVMIAARGCSQSVSQSSKKPST
jgi:hypothetical protein